MSTNFGTKDATKQSIFDIVNSLHILEKEILDNKITNMQTRSTAIKAAVDALNTALQSCTNTANLS